MGHLLRWPLEVNCVVHAMLSNLEKVIDLERTGRQHQPDYMEEPGDLKALKFRGPLPSPPAPKF